jgi:hypothetical protein
MLIHSATIRRRPRGGPDAVTQKIKVFAFKQSHVHRLGQVLAETAINNLTSRITHRRQQLRTQHPTRLTCSCAGIIREKDAWLLIQPSVQGHQLALKSIT